MTIIRNNHYVPQWHQTRFLPAGSNTLCYLDLKPKMHAKGDGYPGAREIALPHAARMGFLHAESILNVFRQGH